MKNLKPIFKIDSKRCKRIMVFGLMVFGLILLLSPNVAYAASSLGSSFEDQLFTQNISGLIKMISHVVYVFIRPCLVIAGTALDNSLVFGKFLHLDAALWNIWNIMKNFANFTLGFVFIFTIVVNLFKGALEKADPMKNAKDTVTATLVAGVLIQMSWFLVAVLIDLSTILIVTIGGLPLSVVQSYNKDVAEVPIMKMNVEITNDESYYYYSYGGHNFAPCLLINKEGDVDENIIFPSLDGEYIAGRNRLYLSDGVRFESGYCTLNGYLYHYEESTGGFFANEGTGHYEEAGNTLEEINTNYYNNLKKYLNYVSTDTGLVEQEKNSCFLISAYGTDYDGECNQVCSGYGDVPYLDDIFTKAADGFTLKELMNKSKGWVGPFVTMYSSILNYQELVMNPGSGSVMGTLFGFIINTFFALVLFIPILILAVLLIIRIGYLWVVVAISPILVLVHTFTKLGGDGPFKSLSGNDGFKKLFAKFGVKEIITQIFSPVIVVFAVSICIVFLSTIYKAKPEKDQASSTLSAFGIECVEVKDDDAGSDGNTNSCPNADNAKQNKKCDYSILGLVTIRLNAQNYNHGKDMFVWVLMELLATGIVWFFMKFAIGMMGSKGQELMKSAQEFVTNIPVVPLPGGHGYVGLNKIGQIGPTKLLNNVSTEMSNESDRILKERFPWAYGIDKDQVSKSTETEVNTVLNEVRAGKKYGDLTEEQQTLVNNYYGGNAEVAENIVNNIYNYNIESNAENVKKIQEQAQHIQKQSSDALKLTDTELNMAVQNEDAWKAWAAGMIGGAVHTLNGVFIVDVIKGTENNPVYTIVDRDTYERNHFGNNTVANVKEEDYDKYREEVKTYLDNIEKEIKDLKEKSQVQGSDPLLKTRLSDLEGMFSGDNAIENLRQKFGISTNIPEQGQE